LPPREERICAGKLLGQLGDPRTEALLPDTVGVAGGLFLFGDAQSHYEDEGPPNWVELPPFAIGCHPITNRDYGRFLAANPQHPSPHYWHDPAYNNPSQPVVGVTWHDARAYCQWLTTQLQAAGLLPNDQIVRLPRETEWEKAASWDGAHWQKRMYPWGNVWDAQCANTADERGDWTVAPIGCFPAGRSFYGAHDLVGNVWEWTLDEYRSYPGAPRPFYEPNTYVLRGSSCQSLASNARCTYRNRLPPSYWRNHIGFRIAIGAAV
jgi:gamma-glutamyl hercynylcysteine S-oxide synthase